MVDMFDDWMVDCARETAPAPATLTKEARTL